MSVRSVGRSSGCSGLRGVAREAVGHILSQGMQRMNLGGSLEGSRRVRMQDALCPDLQQSSSASAEDPMMMPEPIHLTFEQVHETPWGPASAAEISGRAYGLPPDLSDLGPYAGQTEESNPYVSRMMQQRQRRLRRRP